MCWYLCNFLIKIFELLFDSVPTSKFFKEGGFSIGLDEVFRFCDGLLDVKNGLWAFFLAKSIFNRRDFIGELFFSLKFDDNDKNGKTMDAHRL